MDPSFDKQKIALNQKTKEELNVLAKHLGISNFRKLGKESLIQHLIQAGYELKEIPSPTWWQRNHNHVYGILGIVLAIVGLLVTILIYGRQSAMPPSVVTLKVPIDNQIDNQNASDQEAKIALEASSFSPPFYARFFCEEI